LLGFITQREGKKASNHFQNRRGNRATIPLEKKENEDEITEQGMVASREEANWQIEIPFHLLLPLPPSSRGTSGFFGIASTLQVSGSDFNGMIITSPLPPLPLEDVAVDVPGRPPIPMPCWYEASTMLYVLAWPEEEPDEPAADKAVAVAMQPPMYPEPPPPPLISQPTSLPEAPP